MARIREPFSASLVCSSRRFSFLQFPLLQLPFSESAAISAMGSSLFHGALTRDEPRTPPAESSQTRIPNIAVDRSVVSRL